MITFEPRSALELERQGSRGPAQRAELQAELHIPQEKMLSARTVVAREISASNLQPLERGVGNTNSKSSVAQDEFFSFSGAVRDAGRYIKNVFVIPWYPVGATLDWLERNNLSFLILLPPFNVYVGTQAILAIALNLVLVPLAISSALIGTALIGLGSLVKSALR